MKRRLYIEAGIVGFILLVLLTITFPKFLLAQKYGPIRPQDCRDISGEWIWKDGELLQISHKPNTMVLFEKEYDSGEIIFQVKTQDDHEFVRVIYGFKDFEHYYHTWDISGRFGGYSSMHEDNHHKTILFNAYSLFRNSNPRMLWSKGIIPPCTEVLTSDIWHEVRLVVQKNSKLVDGYIDGKPIIGFEHTSSVKGKFGLSTYDTKISVRDLEIRSLSE